MGVAINDGDHRPESTGEVKYAPPVSPPRVKLTAKSTGAVPYAGPGVVYNEPFRTRIVEKVVEPVADGETGDEPTGDEPTGDEPTGDEPTGDEPVVTKPVTTPKRTSAARRK